MESAQPLQTLAVHTSDVNSVDFAGDCILVTASGDKHVRVWEWQKGLGYVEVAYSPLLGHKYGVTCVKVSPQSTMLASSSIDGTTQLWNLRTGAKIHTMVQMSGESVRVCRFSPDSTILVTAGDSGQVCLWDLIRRTLIRSFTKHEGAVQSVCFTPDSCWLVTSCTFGVLKLFSSNDLTDSCLTSNDFVNALVSVDDAHDLGVVGCDVSTNHRQISTSHDDRVVFEKLYQLVTCGNDHDVKLWQISVLQEEKCNSDEPAIASIELIRVFEGHSSALTSVRFSSSGIYIASSGLDKTTIIWQTETGKIMNHLLGHKRYVACCAFSRDGNLLATGSNDKSVVVWDLTASYSVDSEMVRHCSPKLHWTEQDKGATQRNFVEEAQMSSDETSNDAIRLVQTLDEHGGAINSVAIHGNDTIASASSDKFVRLWSQDEEISDEEIKFIEKPFSPLDGHKYSVNHVEFSPCGTMLASCSLDGSTIIWDTQTGAQAKASFVNSGTGIRVCRWSPDGKKIATAGDDEKTSIWDVETLEILRVFEGHADAITTIAFTPDSGFIVTGCNEGAWRMYDIDDSSDSNARLICDGAHDLGVQGSDFSGLSSAAPYAAIQSSARVSFDDNVVHYSLATCGNDSLVKLWQVSVTKNRGSGAGSSQDALESGEQWDDLEKARIVAKEKRALVGHGGNVMNVRFSPGHGEILGSVATDRTARIWSVHSGVCLRVLENHESLVTSCAFSRDSTIFVTGALDRRVLVWLIPRQLVSQGILIDRLRHNKKRVSDWKAQDVAKWMIEIGLEDLAHSIKDTSINGRHLLSMSDEQFFARLYFDENTWEIFRRQLYWLKAGNVDRRAESSIDDSDVPHEYLCPITHEIMREPVKCADGFVYEKAAINEWFLCGKYTSPMTNEPLYDTTFTPEVMLRNAICALIYGEPES